MTDVAETQDSSGFYKYEEILLHGPNAVHGPDFSLLKEEKDNYSYPVEGWYWFDSEEVAKEFFGVTTTE